jgi:hypothetical protein
MSKGHSESNPILGQSRARQGAIVIGSAVAVDFLTQRLHKAGHKKMAKVINFLIGGEHAVAAGYNLRYE